MKPLIVTIYGADGTKVRKPIGVQGKACDAMTRPYEAREIAGQTRKTPTGDMYREGDLSQTERLTQKNTGG